MASFLVVGKVIVMRKPGLLSPSRRLLESNFDVTSIGGVFNRVIQQINHSLKQQIVIAVNG